MAQVHSKPHTNFVGKNSAMHLFASHCILAELEAAKKEAQAVAAKKQAAGKAPAMCNVQSKKAIKKVHVVVWGKAEKEEKAVKGKAKEQERANDHEVFLHR